MSRSRDRNTSKSSDGIQDVSLGNRLWFGLVILVASANLRPAISSIGPVAKDIRVDLDLSNGEVGLLGTIGIVSFGVVAAGAARPARRWGNEPVIACALLALLAGLLLRVLGGVGSLLAGTILACCAIAFGNVLLPGVIKREFPTRTGPIMGLYAMTVSGFAAIAAGATVPLGEWVDHGWRGALGMWSIPAALALLLWTSRLRPNSSQQAIEAAPASLLRDRVAWHVCGFFGLASIVFYALLTWLPTIYREHGYDAETAGFLLFEMSVVGSATSLVMPWIAERLTRDQRVPLVLTTVATTAGLLGMLWVPEAVPHVWMTLIGFGQGGAFALSLGLLLWRTQISADTAVLSAMMNTVGYLIASCGPVLTGIARDLTGSWSASLWMLIAITVPQFILGLFAGRAQFVRQGETNVSK